MGDTANRRVGVLGYRRMAERRSGERGATGSATRRFKALRASKRNLDPSLIRRLAALALSLIRHTRPSPTRRHPRGIDARRRFRLEYASRSPFQGSEIIKKSCTPQSRTSPFFCASCFFRTEQKPTQDKLRPTLSTQIYQGKRNEHRDPRRT